MTELAMIIGPSKWVRKETAEDLRREEEVAELIRLKWDATLYKLEEILYRVDFAFFKGGRHRGFIEVKCRDVLRSTYPSLMLSYQKWCYGKLWAKLGGKRFLVVVRYNDDSVYWIDVTDIDCPIEWYESSDKDKSKSELVVYIPNGEFTFLGEIE